MLGEFLTYAEIVVVPSEITELPDCRDADDVKFLALVKVGKADCLVTGDADLLTISDFKTCPILPPADFRKIIEPAT